MPRTRTATTAFFILIAYFLFPIFPIVSHASSLAPVAGAINDASAVIGQGFAVTPVANSVAYAPIGIFIPSISLAASVRPVGTADDGSMAVPVIANTVGWFAAGTVPGAEGSAVLDAHVYLAFKDLKNVRAGDSIYVAGADGVIRHFVVSATKVYADADVPLAALFTASDAAHLNLITCAGMWLPREGTYSERLVVYATLAA